jgi:penicillin-binding protein 1A
MANRPKTLRMTATKPKRSLGLRIFLGVLKWGLLSVLLLGAIGGTTVATLFWVYGSDPNLPRYAGLKDYQPKQRTRIFSADGKLIGEIFEERRTFVPLDKVAPLLLHATIDAEDAEFRQHGGLDFVGMLRALIVNIKQGRAAQGASTITQQVVKTFLLSPEKSLRRKMQEIILARRLEKGLTKDEILTLYVNQIYYGHGRYGIEEASQFFFGKRAAELDACEASALAGLPQSPERLSPFKHPDAAKARQLYVLEQLVRRGHLDGKEAKRCADAPIKLIKNPSPDLGLAPEWTDLVRKELLARYGEEKLPYLGLDVKVTMNAEMQIAARDALELGLRAIDDRHSYRGPVARLTADKVEAKRKALTKALGDGPLAGQSYEAIVESANDTDNTLAVDLGGWKGRLVLGGRGDARYNPDGKKASARYAKNDVVRVRRAVELDVGKKDSVVLDLGPQGAVVILEPRTRKVQAMVGGYDFAPGGFNRALRAKRQPGSSFKPFVYAAAIDSGKFTPASIVNDAPEVYDLWKPKNYEKSKFLGPVRLRQALALSINTVAIRIMHEVGPERVVQLATEMGIESKLPEEMSLALGSGEVTPLELVNGYATFAAEGQLGKPVFIESIDGKPEKPVELEEVVRPEIAFLTTSMMRSVIEEGTATPVKKLKREVAGKTGTSNSGKDAWFVAFTPDLVGGVWIGYDDMRPLGKGEAGGKAAVPVWVDMMKVALRGKGARSFRQPPGVVAVKIDRKTGLLAPPGATEKDLLTEYFLEGTAPTEIAPAPGEVDPSTFVLEQLDEEGAMTAPSTP